METRTRGTSGIAIGLVTGLTVLASLVTASAAPPIDIGDRNQVFIDGRFLDKQKNVRIVVCPPVKTYEQNLKTNQFPKPPYGTIMAPDGKFRGFNALTKDGTHWRVVEPGTPPEPDDILGYINPEPAKTMVFKDPTAPADERYKLFGWSFARTSADGADWPHYHPFGKVWPDWVQGKRGFDSHNVCFYDRRIGKYVAYIRVNKAYPAPPERQAYFSRDSKKRFGREDRYFLRTVGRAVTDDLAKGFDEVEVVFEPDDKDPRFGGVNVMDFYTPHVIPYEGAQDAYFLFTARYRHFEQWYLADDMSQYRRSGDSWNVGTLDIGFAASRDGVHWHRFEREPWIPLGPPDSFDSKKMYLVYGMHRQGDEIWMYYTGNRVLHAPHTDERKARSEPTVSRVVLRRDGFTAVEADYAGGEFTTPPLTFEGDVLRLNIDTSALGLARVEIQDAAGEPIPGYHLEDCDRIHLTDQTRYPVAWRGGETDVSKLSDQPVRLRFELMHGAKLHAFGFGFGEIGPESEQSTASR